jgi:parallel beta-helix repeat protein
MKEHVHGATCVSPGNLVFDRRTGPADRRQDGRAGGRRKTDMLTTAIVCGSILTGCNSSQSFTPTAPGALNQTQDAAPASPGQTTPEAPSPAPSNPSPSNQSPSMPSGTAINPGDDIQRAVDANPAGTTFVIRSGVHRRQSVRPKNNMSFVGEPGAVLDGENRTPQAFVAYGARNVTIRGLRITNYAPPNLGGAVDGVDSHGWVLENNEIDHNSSGSDRTYGVFVGSGWNVRNNRIHHNGWQGITGWNCVDTVIEGNDIYANPSTTFDDSVGDTANIKMYGCGRITIRNNEIHDGPKKGIWFDRSQPDITIEGNRVVNHGDAGIWYEVSYRGTIRGNHVENAGNLSRYSSGWLRGGGIQITNSPDVSVLDNTVVNSLNGIIGLQAAGYYDGKHGPSQLRNLLVQGNTIVMPRGQSGIATDTGSDAVFDSWNNRFVNNRIQASSGSPFQWKGRNFSEAEWKAGPGKTDTITQP